MTVVPATTHLTDAAAWLRRGLVVAFPTETFYGLGVDAHNAAALSALRRMKGRDERNPFPVLLSGRKALERHAEKVPAGARKLIDRYWPGALTVVLRSRHFPKGLTNPRGGVGFRVSGHPIAGKLVNLLGRELTATSANRSGSEPATKASQIEKEFRDEDLLVLDGGEVPGGRPSSVVDFTAGTRPILVREGAIPWDEIRAVLRGNT